MPIYVFVCNYCKANFETVAKHDENVFCDCGGTTHKRISAHSSKGINSMRNPFLIEEKRKEGKRERLDTFYKKEGRWK